MDIYRGGLAWHDAGVAKTITTVFQPGVNTFLGRESAVEYTCTVSGTVPTSVELGIERIDPDGTVVQLDASAYDDAGVFDVHDKTFVFDVSTNPFSFTAAFLGWSYIRLLARRVGGDATTKLIISGRTRRPDG